MATARLMSINELCEGKDGKPYTFFIPSYQRGYRWDEEQILNLAKDLYDFTKNKEGEDYYCLQPVIVKPHKVHTDKNGKDVVDEWEVIDGQQRLTALWILYTIKQGKNIGKSSGPGLKYNMKYEKKEPFTNYLNNIDIHAKNMHEKLKNLERRERKYDIYSFIEDITQNIQIIEGINIEEIIENVNSEEQTVNIDRDYFIKSINALDNKLIEWVNDTEKSFDGFDDIISPILEDDKKINIIWYELKDEDPIETFVNINANKIALTNAELIKANLLYNVEKDQDDNEAERIAVQWEEIEKSLNNDKFWHFMIKEKDSWQTRIDYLFQIYCESEGLFSDTNEGGAKKDERYAIFNAVSNQFEKADKGAKEVWEKIQKIHDALYDWYNNYDFYHLIGLLIEVSNKDSAKIISELYKEYNKNTKSAFRNILLNEIKKVYGNLSTTNKENSNKNKILFPKNITEENLKEFLKSLDYNDDRENIRKVLLLYNIALLVNSKNLYEYFPFDLYDIQKWDLEHVYPQTPSDAASEEEYRVWLDGSLTLLNDYISKTKANGIKKSDLINRIKAQLTELNKNKSIQDAEINSISSDIMKFLENENIEDKIDSIGNLVLLDNAINRSYHNAQFIGKRNKIIQIERSIYEDDNTIQKNKEKNNQKEEMNNRFIPLGTKWVFLKGYENSKDLIIWKSSDMDEYTADIAEQIVKMFAEEDK